MAKQAYKKSNTYTPSNPTASNIQRFAKMFAPIGSQSEQHPFHKIKKRLDYLATLEDGWYDGLQGKPLENKGLTDLYNAFFVYYDSTLPLPSLYPTLDGKIQAEWSLPKYELSITFNILDKTASYQFLVLATDETEEGNLNFKNRMDWKTINTLLRNYIAS